MAVFDIDPNDTLIGKNDVVRFNNGQFDWRVDCVYGDTVYVTSTVGNRKAIGRVHNIITAKRDSQYIPEPQWTDLYNDDWADEL